MASRFDDDPEPPKPAKGKVVELPKKSPPPSNFLGAGFWIRDAAVQKDLPYVIKGIFGKSQVIVFWGAPGSGKTFVAMEMACHVGAGQQWRGRRVRRGVVLYVAAESARSYIENRFSALKQQNPSLELADVLVVPLAIDLLHSQNGDVDRVIETAKLLTEGDGEVVMIVIDTLAVTFGGGNENSPEDMGAYVGNILHIRDETKAAVLVIHHAGKDEARGMRGHSALLGALDAELAIEGANGSDRLLRTGKVRDGDGYSDLFAFNLRRVELAVDADGDPISTCVVEGLSQEATRSTRAKAKAGGLGTNQKNVLRALEQAAGPILRVELVKKLQSEGMQKNRAYDAIAGLIDSGVIVADNTTFTVYLPK